MSKIKVSSASLLYGSLAAALLGLAAAPASANVIYGTGGLVTTYSTGPFCTVGGFTNDHNNTSATYITVDPCQPQTTKLACTFDTSLAAPPLGVCLPVPAPMDFNYTWDPGIIYHANQVVLDGGAPYIALLDSIGLQPGFPHVDGQGNPIQVWEPLGSSSAGVGPAGATGPAGPTGPQGPTGNTGPMGLQGPTGNTGPIGPQGVAGATGPQGPKGDTGPLGPQGVTGAMGPPGLPGLPGAGGAAGPQGPMGATGPAGPAGPIGATGAAGSPGVGLFSGATVLVPGGVTVPAGFYCAPAKVRFRHDDEVDGDHHRPVDDDDWSRWFRLCTKI